MSDAFRPAVFVLKLAALVLIAALSTGCSTRAAEESPISATAIMGHAEKIVSFGPHPPGSDAQRKVGDYIAGQLRAFGIEARTQEFEAVTPIGRLTMRNIWGVLPGPNPRAIALASHYDSKYFPDFKFVGANDGASSSAVVLELARVLAKRNPSGHTIWFVFFDGEEAIQEWTDLDSLYGSREFVKRLQAQHRLGELGALVLLDLIGEKDLSFRREVQSTPWLVDVIWNTAARLGYGGKFTEGRMGTADDHIPFLEQNVSAVDLIDLDYAYWHTKDDTIDKLSPENMRMVADVVWKALPEIARRLDGRQLMTGPGREGR
jgi:glutaminyl-peptide cyclotransferase